MNRERWISFLETLRAAHKVEPQGTFFASKRDFELFAAFVEQVPNPERIPMLLHAYDRYRALDMCGDPRGADQFETSCWSILISTILSSGIRPDQAESTEILQKSYHRCGHGSDVEPPLTFVEQAFQNQPYSQALFDSVLAYRETLRSSRSTHAANIKRKLSWILWHDSSRMEKSCHTRQMQQAIHSMDSENAFHWQWLLRNTAAGLNSGPSKNWINEGRKRLEQIGEEPFHSALDSWFTFSKEDISLSPAGSAMLRLLVWYAALVDTDRSLPVLMRVAHVSWNKRAPVGKVMAALAWSLRTYGGMRFEAEARLICDRWASDSQEVKRLENIYFPAQSETRQRADEESWQQRKKDLGAQLSATLQMFQEQLQDVSGPDRPAARLFAGLEKDAASIAKPPL